MDITSWIQAGAVVISAVASVFIYLVISPLKAQLEGLKSRADKHETEDDQRFKNQTEELEDKIENLRDDISDGHRAAVKQLGDAITLLGSRIDNMLSAYVSAVVLGSMKKPEGAGDD
jgi:uncharacterized protein YoxC